MLKDRNAACARTGRQKKKASVKASPQSRLPDNRRDHPVRNTPVSPLRFLGKLSRPAQACHTIALQSPHLNHGASWALAHLWYLHDLH